MSNLESLVFAVNQPRLLPNVEAVIIITSKSAYAEINLLKKEQNSQIVAWNFFFFNLNISFFRLYH